LNFKSTQSIAVIIPFHQLSEAFYQCLSSIYDAKDSLNEIILVNDGENRNIDSIPVNSITKIIETGGKKGPAHARNIGANHAQSDILCFIDSDIVVPNNLFEHILTVFQDKQEIAALFGSYDDTPKDLGFLSQYRNLLHHYVHQISNENASTFWTGCGAIRRSIFLELKGFNEGLYKQAEIEDIELGYRLKAKGYTILLVKELQVKHLKSWRPFNLIEADLLYRSIPWTRLILSQKNAPNDLNLRTKDKVSVTLTFLSLLFLGASIWDISFLFGVVLSCIFLFILNISVYNFFYQKRGKIFTLKVLPWHWLFYFLSGIGFSFGTIIYFFDRLKKR